jgi:CubicO group peptidase (beta-lactamase class C family)
MQSRLVQSSPEAQGISSSAIFAFVEDIEKEVRDLHSFMLLRHGQVVAEGWWQPYAPELSHMLFSLSKSYTSTAIGMAVTEKLLSVDDTVLSFFPEDSPPKVTRNLAEMRIRHLLSMCSGHANDTTRHLHQAKDGNWVKRFLRLPVKYKPGTHFLYNTGATYMLSAILQKVSGITLLEYLRPRLFEPLGIENPTWETCPRGINTGGYGLKVRTQDIAWFGQMYLQKGMWNGKRILSEAWITDATSKQISNGSKPDSDWEQGYGYQFWCCTHGAYRGDGAFGQYCIVMPEQDAVLAITSGLGDMQIPLNIIWKHLLPAMKKAQLSTSNSAQTKLNQKLSDLMLQPQEGVAESPLAADVSGKLFQLHKNKLKMESVSLGCAKDKTIFTMRNADGEYSLTCGHGAWLKCISPLYFPVPQPAAASGAWKTPDTYEIKVCLVETPFVYTITLHFAEKLLEMALVVNVSFSAREMPLMKGRMK